MPDFGQPDPKPNTSTIPEELDLEQFGGAKVSLKINGRDEVVPLKDVVARAQKGTAAERRLQEAAEREKELAEELEQNKAIRDGYRLKDPEMFIQGLVRAGVPRDVAEPWVKGAPQGGRPDPEEDDDLDEDDDSSAKTAEKLLSTIRNMPEMQVLREMAGAYETNKKRVGQQEKVSQIKTALDNDPELSKLYSSYAGKPRAQKALLDSVALAVQGRLPEFPGWGPRPIQAGLADAKATLLEQGILSDGTSTSPGLGSSAFPVPGAHLTEDAALIVQDQKNADKHRSIFDPDYSKSVTARVGRFFGRRDE